jgi:hypothetical protein
VPVPLPNPDDVLLEPPSADESTTTARGIATAVRPTGGLTPLQRALLESMFEAMTGTVIDADALEPLSAPELAAHLARRNLQFRTRGVQVMLLCALVLRPLPREVVDRVTEYAVELGVDEGMIRVAQQFAAGHLGLAGVDFERNGYTADWDGTHAEALHTSRELQSAWESAVADPALAARWHALGELPPGSLGRGVWEMYQARGFVVPGLPGSAPPLLAQHDWVHVLADFGTTVEAELEVFALIARANDDMRAFSLLAMVVSLFETGYLRTGAGLFEAAPGRLSGDRSVVVRMADAMKRGALCRDVEHGEDSIDFLRVNWFELAAMPTEEVPTRFSVIPKSSAARDAGSVGPFESGGISEFQRRAGMAMAERERRPYLDHGAVP